MKKRMSRVERKKKEYFMAAMRTWCNVVMTAIGIIGFIFTLLIYHKVYFNGN
jgi:preprotein translocase subunit Sss1